jgi:hypothetical protein
MKFLGPPSSGSQAGTTSSRNRNGQYTRSRATPVNPRSTAQVNQRSRQSTNSAAWRALTNDQRAGWGSLGSEMTRSDALGQVYTLTGAQAYNSVNNNNTFAGVAIVSDAPLLVTPTGLLSVTLTLSSIAFSVAFTPTPLAAGQRILIRCSPQRSAGRSFEADYRQIFAGAAASASPSNILAAYTAKFGVPVTGRKIFVSCQVFQSGFLSQAFLAAAIVG